VCECERAINAQANNSQIGMQMVGSKCIHVYNHTHVHAYDAKVVLVLHMMYKYGCVVAEMLNPSLSLTFSLVLCIFFTSSCIHHTCTYMHTHIYTFNTHTHTYKFLLWWSISRNSSQEYLRLYCTLTQTHPCLHTCTYSCMVATHMLASSTNMLPAHICSQRTHTHACNTHTYSLTHAYAVHAQYQHIHTHTKCLQATGKIAVIDAGCF
jgi:hypothetical protein